MLRRPTRATLWGVSLLSLMLLESVCSFILAPSLPRTTIKKNPPLVGRQHSLQKPPFRMATHEVEDDDEISQHEFMSVNGTNPDPTSMRTGYRPIEEWHEETKNSKHALDQLRMEKAKWARKFEDLGGDGI
jgi:hypothetical protein